MFLLIKQIYFTNRKYRAFVAVCTCISCKPALWQFKKNKEYFLETNLSSQSKTPLASNFWQQYNVILKKQFLFLWKGLTLAF